MKSETLTPLFLTEILKFLRTKNGDLNFILDGTFGSGGHTLALKNHFPKTKIFALDRDLSALKKGEKKFSNEIKKGTLQLIHGDFISFFQPKKKSPPTKEKPLDSLKSLKKLDVLLFDLGPSLSQLTQSQRGFSFYLDGPLDMRMDQSQNHLTASEILNTWNEDELNNLFINFGEIKRPFRVVRSILKQRKKKPFESTLELARLIEKTLGWKKKSRHPATLFFQSLRIKVNDELLQIKKSFPNFFNLLNSKGLFFVISFHSLEDRLIKNFFKTLKVQKKAKILTPKVIQASYKEKKTQPRLRSAKLRILQKL